jgi:HK97 gp10 family phage protein
MAASASSHKLEFTLQGREELKKQFNSVAEAVGTAKARTALKAGGLVIQNDAKRRAPYLTGTLRRSIAMEDGPGATEITIGTDVEYAGFVEFGTYKMAARPYLRPAFDENIPEVTRTIAEALSDLIEAAL